MKKYEFFVNDPGDPSVGIWPAHSKVTIETDLDFDQDVPMIKATLSELFDCSVILTAEEAEEKAEETEMKFFQRLIDGKEKLPKPTKQ